MINVAFYDEARRCLVQHELMSEPRSTAGMVAIHLGLMWKTGKHRMPSRYWVVWDDPEDLGIFPLDQVDSDYVPLPEAMCDHILECARTLTKRSKP